ncbi:coiled-coil domain-containing protein 89-like [Hippoglossus stenolepis]|uniref:coiled-coil domain-containing protein 89-like n=1 Tax=Hippoglossus stenolepis TaxID=195615 RepID=UPI001FAEF86C|nr:coiled-coil domain-containing protein 89-like [Hippoglossus stenolepis]
MKNENKVDVRVLKVELQQAKTDLACQAERVRELQAHLQKEIKRNMFLSHMIVIHTTMLQEKQSLIQEEKDKLDRLRFDYQQQSLEAKQCNDAREADIRGIALLEGHILEFNSKLNMEKNNIAELEKETSRLSYMLQSGTQKNKALLKIIEDHVSEVEEGKIMEQELRDLLEKERYFSKCELEALNQNLQDLAAEMKDLKKKNLKLTKLLKIEKDINEANEKEDTRIFIRLEEEIGRRRFLSKKEEGLNTEIQKEAIRILELKDQLQKLNSLHQQELEAAGRAEETLYLELEKLKIANTEIPTKMKAEEALSQKLQIETNQLSVRLEAGLQENKYLISLTAELQKKQNWRLGLNNCLQMEKHTHQQKVEALRQELVNLEDNNLDDIIKLRAVEVSDQTFQREAVHLRAQLRECQEESLTLSEIEPVCVEKVRKKSKRPPFLKRLLHFCGF